MVSTFSIVLPNEMFFSSPQITLEVNKPSKTPGIRTTKSLTVISIQQDTGMGGYRLKSLLLVQLQRTRNESIATTWLEGVAEYGTAKTDDAAITDLVNSLGEYRETLQRREDTLGEEAKKELTYLQGLIESIGESS